MQFSDFDLDPRLLRNLQAIEFEQPTPIQRETIPHALKGRDVLGSAETGTGKTAAFLLPLMQKLIDGQQSKLPRALIVAPTRELALQVTEHAEQLSRGLPLRMVTIYGGVGYKTQLKALRQGVDIVIATPGRLLDHAGSGNIDFAALQVFVLDEADRMLDIGFLPDIRRIASLLPRERQTMLFSATLQPIVRLSREITHEPVRIEVEKDVTPDTITQVLYPVPEHLKLDLLQHLLKNENLDSVLLFTRTKRRADRLVRDLKRTDISAAVIHGDRSQGQRIAALDKFKEGGSRVLVATDIAARGIDVEGISHVVNYDVPNHPEDYIHRIGRTGRAQAVGKAYTFATPKDSRMIHRIEYILQEKLERRKVDAIDYTRPAARIPTPEEIRRYVEANRRKPKKSRKSKGQRGRKRQRNNASNRNAP